MEDQLIEQKLTLTNKPHGQDMHKRKAYVSGPD